VRANGQRVEYHDGDVVFKAGDAAIDFFVIESGELVILNPTADNAVVKVHGAGGFAGDIDMLTRRPVIVTAIARGPGTVLLRVPNDHFRKVLHAIPQLGEKLVTAFAHRRQLLQASGVLGLKIIGPIHCAQTNLLREFLHKNFVPFTSYEPAGEPGARALQRIGKTAKDSPVVICADGSVHVHPTLRTLSRCVGLYRKCPTDHYDLAIVGGGPAGMAAAVYASSEAVNTVVLDRLGPGGQASGSSMIENFIGFPSGLSGTELGTRGALQMYKFGALFLTPVVVQRLVPGEDFHTIYTDGEEVVRARTVLIATGVKWRRLVAKNAEKFDNNGIYYAATTVESRM